MEWKQDILGPEFEMASVAQPDDYTGKVRCTVIRLKSEECSSKGVLYVHGFSDYFFQKEMAHIFAAHRYNFYAVDLRRYGRSLVQNDQLFRVRDLHEYFADIQVAIDAMKSDGNSEIILLGHSTGGLTTSLYMMSKPDPSIKALILNSPFLTWNLPYLKRVLGIPLIKFAGRFNPRLRIKGDGTNYYAASLARHLGGEWEYDKNWKPDVMPDVDAEWVRAIDNAQIGLKKGKIKVPVLLLHSDKSAYPGDGKNAYATSDAVLNVNTMARKGRNLGERVEEITIHDGLHDLVLSRKDVREKVYSAIFSFLSRHGL